MSSTANPSLCSCCPRCLTTPCERLRYGGVREGAFLLVTGQDVNPGMIECPFAVHDFDEASNFLTGLSLTDLIDCIEYVTLAMDPVDMIGIDPRLVVTSYGDFAARMQLLQALWDSGAVRMIRVPLDYARNPRLRSFLLAFESLMPSRVAAAPEQAAVTDEVEETAAASAAQPKLVTICIRLNIDPNDPASDDDEFTLHSTDSQKSYSKKLTVKDDKVPGDNSVDLEFTECPDNLCYTLEVDPGKEGKPFDIFTDKKYEEI